MQKYKNDKNCKNYVEIIEYETENKSLFKIAIKYSKLLIKMANVNSKLLTKIVNVILLLDKKSLSYLKRKREFEEIRI